MFIEKAVDRLVFINNLRLVINANYVILIMQIQSSLHVKINNIHYRSELWDHLFFDDCLNYLNFNFVSDEICTLKNAKAIKIIFKISLE